MTTDGREVLDRLTRIEVKLDSQLTHISDHEGRLRRLERTVWIAMGAAAAIGGAAGSIAQQAMGGGA